MAVPLMLPPIPRPVSVKREQTGDPRLDRIQEDLRRTADALNATLVILSAHPLMRARPIAVRFPNPGSFKTVRHNLGEPAVCFPMRQNYDAGAAGPAFAENPTQPATIDKNNELSIASTQVCNVVLLFVPRALVDLAIDTSLNQSPVL